MYFEKVFKEKENKGMQKMALLNMYHRLPLTRLINELDHLYYRPWPTLYPSYWDAFDGVENFEKTDNGYLMEVMVPGFTKETLNVEVLEGKYLSVYGEVKLTRKEATNLERKFSQRWLLPKDVETESLRASVENGVLTVYMNKKETPSKKDVQKIYLS